MAKKKSAPKVTLRKMADYLPDDQNANEHTERGMDVLEKAVGEVGWLGAMTVDANGKLIAGNARQEIAARTGFDDVIEIEVNGDQPVVIKRRELDLDSADDDVRERSRRAAIIENRAHELNQKWNAGTLLALRADGVNMSKAGFTDSELKYLAVMQLPSEVEFPEYDESVGDEVSFITCPHCNKQIPL